MPDPAPTDPPKPTDPPSPPTDPPKPTDPPEPDGLGDAGKKAIAAERDARKAAEDRAKAAEAELDKLRKAQMSDADKAIADAKATAKAEADQTWTARVVRAEAMAAAATKVVDAETAVALLDLSKIPVTDGEVDRDALAKAIDALVEAKPFLKPGEPGKPPTPKVPGGPRNDGKGSITREQLKTMSSADIEKARVAGELDHLLKG